jgi:hypothetical protein
MDSHGRVEVKKMILLAAMLTMVVVATVPALAQQTEEPSEFTLVPGDRYDAARCPFPVMDAPATGCTVDENGFITTPDGTKVPYSELSDEPLYDTYTGNLVKFVDGEPVVVKYGQPPAPAVPDAQVDGTSAVQYDNADTARCLDPLADHRNCSAWINPDGSLSQA